MATKVQERRWELTVYVANGNPRSSVAVFNLKRLCDQYLSGGYRIQLVDLAKKPHRSRQDQILAIPTVVRQFPLPEKRVIGTLSNAESGAAALGLKAAGSDQGWRREYPVVARA